MSAPRLRAAVLAAPRSLEPSALHASCPLASIGAAFQALEERPDGFLKAVVTP